MNKLYYASGLNIGGGLTILNIFFKKLDSKNFFFIDERIRIKKKNNVYIVKNNLLSKILSEIRIKKIIKHFTKVIFLNGLPPLIRYNNQVSVYFQNANIIPIKFLDFFAYFLV